MMASLRYSNGPPPIRNSNGPPPIRYSNGPPPIRKTNENTNMSNFSNMKYNANENMCYLYSTEGHNRVQMILSANANETKTIQM